MVVMILGSHDTWVVMVQDKAQEFPAVDSYHTPHMDLKCHADSKLRVKLAAGESGQVSAATESGGWLVDHGSF